MSVHTTVLTPKVPTPVELNPVELNRFSEKEICLIQWEEWSLSMEEHFHATAMFERNPTGRPMGHR